MKRYCKKVDLTDIDFITECAKDCLSTRWKRRDTWRYFNRVTKLPIRTLKKADRDDLIKIAAYDVQRHIQNRDAKFIPIKYYKKFDGSSCKEREIGIQDFEQQLYDYVAVAGLNDMLRRVGEYQCASIKNRGMHYGIDAIKKWFRGKDRIYTVKMDIKKCFPSIPQDRLLAFIDKYVANDDLRWLVRRLLGEMKNGLSIGSYLSQHLCNLYLSQLYHEIAENMYYTRRGKRINSVDHVLFYMDDILLVGGNKKELTKAAKRVVEFTETVLGLTIKPNWKVTSPSDSTCIDMMGYRIYRHHTNIRRRTFLRIRRAFKRARKHMTLKRARTIISYQGYFKYGALFKIAQKLHVYGLTRKARRMISGNQKRANHESNILRRTKASLVCA